LILLAMLLLAVASTARAALLGHGGPVRAVAVSADGHTVVTGGFDYSVLVWDLPDETLRWRLIAHAAPVGAVAVTADGATALSAGDDGMVGVWDLRTGTLRHELRVQAKLAALAVSSDGSEFAAGSWDGKVHRWRLADVAELPTLDQGSERVTSLAYRGGELLVGGHEGKLRAWRLADAVRELELPAHDFALTGLVALQDGTILTGAMDGRLKRWDRSLQRVGDGLDVQAQPMLALAANRDGSLVASSAAKGEVLLWDGAGAHPIHVLAASGSTVWALAFTPDGSRLLGGGADGAVRIWDTHAGSLLGRPLPRPAPQAQGRGPELFAKCAACHTLTGDGGNRAGPPLTGLFGRRAGAVAGYPYSDALRDSGIVWTEETVARLFDLGPDRFVPGSKMPLQRLPDPRDRDDLIDYLKHMSGR
jgi:cytochrome c